MCWRVDTAQAHKVKAEVPFGNGVKVMPPILTTTSSTHNYDEESLFSRVKDMPPSCEYMDADSVKAVDEAGGIISSSPHAHTHTLTHSHPLSLSPLTPHPSPSHAHSHSPSPSPSP